jgi:hypothetical protein
MSHKSKKKKDMAKYGASLMIQALQACFLGILLPRLCLGLIIFKAFSLAASKMLA